MKPSQFLSFAVGLALLLPSGLSSVSWAKSGLVDLQGGLFPPDVKTVGVVSVSSIIGKENLASATNHLVRAGYHVKVMPNVLKMESPDLRAKYFEQAWMDPEIDFLIFSCGGKGASNVVSRIDWDRLRERKMRVMGFSDVTLVLNAMDLKGVGQPIAGPMLSRMVDGWTAETGRWVRNLLGGTPPPLRLRPVKPCASAVTGCPIGGLLSRFPVLLDMKLLPSFSGRVVIFECTPKYADRAEADLDALVAAGAFDGAAAVVFADFNRTWEKERTDALFARFATKVKCPVFSGYPFGHVGRSLAFDFTRPLTITPEGVLEWNERTSSYPGAKGERMRTGGER